MLNDGNRVQFRLTKARADTLAELALAANTSPSQFAKRLVEAALDAEEIDGRKLAEDLLVIRAGVEQLFRRADRVDELTDAIARVRRRREVRENQTVAGGVS
ncbi:MAG: hypothetical protein AAFN03_11485 [Pseudomonadota bacterium]